MKIKDGDVEEEIELDLDNEDELRRHVQMSRAAQRRMQEAAHVKKDAQEFFKRLQEDPVSVLQDKRIGIDFRQIAEEYLAKQLEEQMLTPEERRLKQAEQIIREREQESKDRQSKAEQEEMAKLQAHYTETLQKTIVDALSSGGVPKTRSTVKRMAELMKRNIDLGLDMEPRHLAQLVREDYQREIKEIFEATDDDGLLALMGDPIANKIRKADLKRLKASQPASKVSQQPASSAPKAESKPMSPDEWRASLQAKVNS